jgi:hypothetical protein
MPYLPSTKGAGISRKTLKSTTEKRKPSIKESNEGGQKPPIFLKAKKVIKFNPPTPLGGNRGSVKESA